jgi:hypothetical protein
LPALRTFAVGLSRTRGAPAKRGARGGDRDGVRSGRVSAWLGEAAELGGVAGGGSGGRGLEGTGRCSGEGFRLGLGFDGTGGTGGSGEGEKTLSKSTA